VKKQEFEPWRKISPRVAVCTPRSDLDKGSRSGHNFGRAVYEKPPTLRVLKSSFLGGGPIVATVIFLSASSRYLRLVSGVKVRMLYSFQAAVLFVHVSRTAGVSIQACMRAGLNNSTILGSSQHAPLCEARTELGELFDSTYKFAVVRNPWDRLVSWYAYLAAVTFARDLDKKSQSAPDAAHWKEFDAYLDVALRETCRIDGEERLMLSQFHQLADAEGQLLVDGLGRFENLADDVPRLFSEANLKCPPLKQINQSNHVHYSAYYSDYGRELVGALLKDDVEGFDYQFDAGVHP